MSAAKRARTAPQPEDLQKGVPVIFHGGAGEPHRGTVHDAFAPLDQFWVKDDVTGEIVRDEGGEIVQFRASELELVLAPVKEVAVSSVRVLVVGTEHHMLAILRQFGSPDESMRHTPQQLLAVPCSECKCHPNSGRFDPLKREVEACPIVDIAKQGISPGMQDLAERLRPDIKVRVRPFYLKQALDQIGPDLCKLQDYYCLVAVDLPFGLDEIEAAADVQRYWMEEIRCQIDLNCSAQGTSQNDASLEEAAKRFLGEMCGTTIASSLWAQDAQMAVKRRLGVDVPLTFWDGSETKVFVLILPEEAVAQEDEGLVRFSASSRRSSAGRRAVSLKTSPADKSVADWQGNQDEFRHLSKLPPNWIRAKTRGSGEIYFFNTRTNESSWEEPLPDGWTKQKSKSSGKDYYFHAKRRKSQFKRPGQDD